MVITFVFSSWIIEKTWELIINKGSLNEKKKNTHTQNKTTYHQEWFSQQYNPICNMTPAMILQIIRQQWQTLVRSTWFAKEGHCGPQAQSDWVTLI